MSGEEYFDVCDADDRVIGRAPRSEVHARKLLHRAVHIFVFRTQGDFLLHRRSATKDEYPLCYTSSASGHVSSGDDYDETARRELAEELGLTCELRFLQAFPASADTAWEHTRLYLGITDDVPHPDPQEVESVQYLPWADVLQLRRQNPDEFSPPFRVLLDWYAAHATAGGLK